MAKNKRNKYRKFSGPKPQPVKAELMPTLDTSFLKAATVTIPDWQFVQIILAGAGGGGSFMALHIARLMHSIYRMGKGVHLTICDPQIVEEENAGRSNFCDAEVEAKVPKAETLARRFSQAWGLNISSYVGDFEDSLILGRELTVLVGCVDGARGRQAMHEVLKNNPDEPSRENPPTFWWLDNGNVNNFGRVLLGSAYSSEQMMEAFPSPGKCISLPSPALQYPDLLKPQKEETDEGAAGMSCAERAAANLQSLNINAAVVIQAADMLTRLLITKDLKRFACEVNLASGVMRSSYVTPEEVARASRKPAAFLTGHTEHSQPIGIGPQPGAAIGA